MRLCAASSRADTYLLLQSALDLVTGFGQHYMEEVPLCQLQAWASRDYTLLFILGNLPGCHMKS